MNILIIGDGKVGYTLAECLSGEGHDITIIDNNPQALIKASETLDVRCVKGNAANIRTMLEAGVGQADVIIACTTNDELNMVCCLAAKQLGAKYSIARIRDPEYTESLTFLQRELLIDMVINPERAAALEISHIMRFPFADNIESFAHGRVEMVEFKVDQKDGITGVPLRDMHGRFRQVLFCALKRGQESLIPNGETVILPGDRLYVVGDRASITHFFKQIGRYSGRAKSAIILGGGYISYYLASAMSVAGMKMTIIELNKEKCVDLAERLPDAAVVNGDGTDQELLENENVRNMDALVCLTNRDEENLITGLYGVRSGVKKVIVKVNRLNYMDIIGEMGIDCVVSPKLLTANAIIRAVRARSQSEGSIVEKVYRILNGEAEALEFTAREGANYIGVPLSQLNIRSGALVAVIVRGSEIIIPGGSDHIEPNDTLILMAKSSEVVGLEDALRGTREKP